MAEIIRMPKLSDTMTEGVVSEWHKKIGDKVKSGDLLAEIETDKANMEFESYGDGILLHIGVEAGNAAPINSILAILGKEGEDVQAILASEGSSPTTNNSASKTEEKKEEKVSMPTVELSNSNHNQFIKASPLAKKMAKDKGIDITSLQGSGPDGRVIKKDIEEFKGGNSATAAPVHSISVGQDQEIPHTMMRKTIARRLSESKFSSPHFYLTMDIDMDKAMEDRTALNEALADNGVKVSFNHLVVKACAIALKKHPKVNSQWTDTSIILKANVNIGIAVAIDAGLVVPVLNNADFKSIAQIASEANELGTKAKNGKLQPTEMDGNTFTISNLGMYDIESFTAVINPPESAILAVGKIVETPIRSNGQVDFKPMMNLTVSADHRVLDGASVAMFLQELKSTLENPFFLARSME